ncbi:ABC transporter permease [Nocardia arthritidis]|uniref:ABC transporter permease n=1 Tax=Nocardia arthritidis TaxID=228602 RepID=A0A6G9YFP5_9NOCA|nr:ABC transporter permease [Nocardia arthritidis]QIS11960.1 ABC transporter permease [Nocardia arthritidis]
MTTAVAGRHYAAPAARTAADFAGTGRLLRLYLRRDRIVLPLWSLLFGLVPIMYLSSTKKLYDGKPAELAQYAKTIQDSPALHMMYGRLYATDLPAVALWKGGPFFTLIAVATILTVIRHTRVEEDTGRAELVGATSIGRYAGLTAALILTGAGCLITGLVCAVTLKSEVSGAHALAFGAALAASGLLWGGVAAVAAQAGSTARVARGMAFGALAAAFALRAIGDAGNGVLSWFSPVGWCVLMRPMAEIRWWTLIPLLALTVIAWAGAYSLLRLRDTGAGLVAERPGPAAAAAALSGPAGLAWRLQRGTLLVWAIGFALYGALMGGIVRSIGDMINKGSNVGDVVTRIGGTHALEDAFVTAGMTTLAMAAGAYTISATLRLHDEEASQRVESTLSGAVSRPRYVASHISFALLGAAFLVLLAATVFGLVYGIAADDVPGKLSDTLGAALVQVPAAWVLTGITVALYGIAPRLTPVAWGVFSTLLIVWLLGAVNGLPHWTADLVPYNHPPKLPGAEFTAAPELWLLAVAAGLIAVGAVAFRRRDLR